MLPNENGGTQNLGAAKDSVAKISAAQIYSIMTKGSRQLTEEQRAAVEDASIVTPSLIVAGAGSGKTELMAVRVLWLVANGYAAPNEILGLTFTRKAASELNRRIFENLLTLRASELWPAGLDFDFLPPNVSTYNSYANTIFRDSALALGYEPDAPMLTDAGAYLLAKETVLKYGTEVIPELADADYKIDTLVGAVQKLAAEMTDHLATADQIEDEITKVLESMTGLEQVAGKGKFEEYSYLKGNRSKVQNTPLIARLAEAYQQSKRRQGYVDYSDQVALAELAVRTIPEVFESERSKYKFVLLDEYQDTSFLQTRLLTGLFNRKPVYAVGDPNQSIYGWRGASATNLSEFGNDFGTGFGTGDFASTQFKLSTSWRNPSKVLELANHLAKPLAETAGELNLVTLQSRENAGAGLVEAQFFDSSLAEATQIAEWFKAKMAAEGPAATAALLMRSRTQMPMFVEQLEARGLEVEVVGLGGLLEMPEVVDLVSALKVLARPDAGSELIRLLTGPRWRIGVSDIAGLHRYAKSVAKQLKYEYDEDFGADGTASLVDALDIIADSPSETAAGITEIGFVRLKNAAKVLRQMRQLLGLNLSELVTAVSAELWLDIEVMSHANRKHPMAHLNAFSNVVANYVAGTNYSSLSTFLDWLDFAEGREKFEIPSVTPESGVIQVMTVHASKGLEWDFVAVCNLVERSFPSTVARDGHGWLKESKLPYPLRGDSASLPVWQYENPADQKSSNAALKKFEDDCKSHQIIEETRLVYVAVTRPKKALMLTGAAWKPGVTNAVDPSIFLKATHQVLPVKGFEPVAGFDDAPWEAWVSAEAPAELGGKLQQWPIDPLSEKSRALLTRAAADTLSALANPGELAEVDELNHQIDLLLGERERLRQESRSVDLPVRVPASRFKDFILKTAEVAEQYRRPMPSEPYAATRTGTLFHNWIEASYANTAISIPFEELDDLDLQNIELDVDAEDLTEAKLDFLKANFAQSEWVNQTPVAVEIEVQLTHGLNTFICKLDAVFETENGVEIVDWKTGKPPKDESELQERSMQLALYKMAYSSYSKTKPGAKAIEPSAISVAFFYVADNKVIRPTSVLDEAQIFEMFEAKVVRPAKGDS
jgi:DNA helicase-2/ATP-dependent DNA helicase PcrA